MSDFEWAEAQGQINLFEYVDSLTVDSIVQMELYEDELTYVEEQLPHLLMSGKVIGQKVDFVCVRYGEITEWFAPDKLKKVP